MLEFKYGLLLDGNESERYNIETDCHEGTFQDVVNLVKTHGGVKGGYNVDMVVDTLRVLGYKAEFECKSTNKDFAF